MTILHSLSFNGNGINSSNIKTSNQNNNIDINPQYTNTQSSNSTCLFSSNFSQTIYIDKKPNLPPDPALKCNIL
ncbi:hypothetical protein DICPUDRAFT_150980 [Dictyostelium purpureum]|uniref:Uncharacterized protein n=1 Tax=Dictyostelium purpureum TaxID=5786 RepID=F0ZHQ5_DICPU|nr:uncharacterized protein DICPUDRAFT_150980 [Dictyostelium purpureum]EGC36503.1 hypothetical protein DICPUDRAFT_150980 [Dictyostelium purpureum]|eukprot:XP_003286948.1 hypothetical protein DICPUDRAFT_150980 [Dictyostelium purpureum]